VSFGRETTPKGPCEPNVEWLEKRYVAQAETKALQRMEGATSSATFFASN
jgi:hypothetical protein